MCIVDPFLLQSEYLLAIRELPPLFGGREAVKDKRNRESNHEKYVVKRFVKGPKTGEKKKIVKSRSCSTNFYYFHCVFAVCFSKIRVVEVSPSLVSANFTRFFFSPEKRDMSFRKLFCYSNIIGKD